MLPALLRQEHDDLEQNQLGKLLSSLACYQVPVHNPKQAELGGGICTPRINEG